jgi:fumarate hydratase subunit alpha
MEMRTIDINEIIDVVERLCMEANYNLSEDVYNAMKHAIKEEADLGSEILQTLIENADLAREGKYAMCQDTGMAVVFVEVGQQVFVEGGLLSDAINEGVRRGYERGYLRKSVVKDPIDRINTKDNTPAVIHYNIVGGDKLKITIAPKGFGSENMSSIKMLTPSAGLEGVMNFVVETVEKGGQNACPPLVVGVGVGGTMEKAALLAKTALLRPVGVPSGSEFWRDVEDELKKRINALGIGPGGLGGVTTVLCVNIEPYPTHITGLPVAVNINCHAVRHAEAVL